MVIAASAPLSSLWTHSGPTNQKVFPTLVKSVRVCVKSMGVCVKTVCLSLDIALVKVALNQGSQRSRPFRDPPPLPACWSSLLPSSHFSISNGVTGILTGHRMWNHSYCTCALNENTLGKEMCLWQSGKNWLKIQLEEKIQEVLIKFFWLVSVLIETFASLELLLCPDLL